MTKTLLYPYSKSFDLINANDTLEALYNLKDMEAHTDENLCGIENNASSAMCTS